MNFESSVLNLYYRVFRKLAETRKLSKLQKICINIQPEQQSTGNKNIIQVAFLIYHSAQTDTDFSRIFLVGILPCFFSFFLVTCLHKRTQNTTIGIGIKCWHDSNRPAGSLASCFVLQIQERILKVPNDLKDHITRQSVK